MEILPAMGKVCRLIIAIFLGANAHLFGVVEAIQLARSLLAGSPNDNIPSGGVEPAIRGIDYRGIRMNMN